MSLRVRAILVYLAIAFGGVWPYLFFVRLSLGWSLINPLVQLPVAFMPAIGAFVVRRWVTREGFVDAGLRLRFRRAWRHWLVAWLMPLGVTALALAGAATAGWWNGDLSPAGGPGGIFLLLMLQVVLTPAYMGEEFGWTSFLWPRLIPGRPRRSVAATGFIWAVWHYPLAYLGYAEFSDHTVSMAVWTIQFMLFEVMLCWLYAKTGSVWATSLAHAGNNMVQGVLTEQLLINGGHLDALRVIICVDLALSLVCIPLVRSKAFTAAPGKAIGLPAADQPTLG
ncbi:CPBP family intramembrane glutamic endopeptidase [Actinoplanes sp. N902-109]|uniref:CPBP family intramembrane glutamic endopeptidase n=1 Tax=Actinoplanes sp. (strain N902-109) TaxID=649831 RepID=UPI0003293B14|nr:CPBP family intramembrane glutamic endopeptidase [Actinoplanes sp. N902-109]AGL15578.1 Abortive infection protein [Actinoplanes sp. N902-109]